MVLNTAMVSTRPLCTVYGCKRRASQGFKRCTPCRLEIRARQAEIVAERRRLGRCPCGAKRVPRTFKRCADCRAYFSGRQAELQEERRLDGMCPRCGREPATDRALCSSCLQSARAHNKLVWERWKLSGKPPRKRPPDYWRRNQEGVGARVAAWKQRQRDAGRCVTCGADAEGFAKCQLHRDIEAQRKRERKLPAKRGAATTTAAPRRPRSSRR